MGSETEIQAARAIATQARVHPANPLRDPRALVSPATNWRKTDETCPWCNQPNDRSSSGWHEHCLRYYNAARGATHYQWDGKATPLIGRTPCAECGGEAQKIDHVVPLATAQRTGSAEMLKAWTPHNLQWVCISCYNSRKGLECYDGNPEVPDFRPSQPNLF